MYTLIKRQDLIETIFNNKVVSDANKLREIFQRNNSDDAFNGDRKILKLFLQALTHLDMEDIQTLVDHTNFAAKGLDRRKRIFAFDYFS